MIQHFEQGIKIRDRYIYDHQFITGEYRDFDVVYVRSTDVNRTLMSAYSHLAGFYDNSNHTYPHGYGRWPSQWTPVPVHTVESHRDHLLNADAHCPKRHEIKESLKSNPKFKIFMSQQEPLLRIISQKTGINTDDFHTYSHVEKFYAGTKIEKENNLNIPSWITHSLWEQYINGKFRQDDYFDGNADFGLPENVELIALKGGVLLKTMIDNMDLVLEGKTKKKFFMYSAHDTTVSAFLRTLQAKQEILGYFAPDYAATVIMELWESDNKTPFIRARYLPNVEAQVQHITKYIKGCKGGDDCTLTDFKTRSHQFLGTHIHHMCGDAKMIYD
uniref:acid phosphatase n=1 Tax=Panagrolaimus superbus TaxID=310955 RepID=A0A914ZCU8_9BILA